MTKLTVVLTTYNRADNYLPKALEAILRQTYRDYILFVVDHMSTDNTAELIKKYMKNDCRIHYILHEEPQGFDFMTVADTEYVIGTHDDDIAEETLFEKEVAALDRDPLLGLVAPSVNVIDENDRFVRPFFHTALQKDRIYEREEFIHSFLSNYHTLDNAFPLWPSVMYRTSAYRKSRRTDIDPFSFTLSGDILIEMMINEHYRTAILKDVLYNYRVHSSQDSSNGLGLSAHFLHFTLPYARKYMSDKEYHSFYEKQNEFYGGILMSRMMTEMAKASLSNDVNEFIHDELRDQTWAKRIDLTKFRRMAYRLAYLQKQFGDQGCEYVLWGSGGGADVTKQLIDHAIPKMRCIGYIDGLKSGLKDGLPITKECDFDFTQKVYYVIATTQAGYSATQKLQARRLEMMKDYIMGGCFEE